MAFAAATALVAGGLLAVSTPATIALADQSPTVCGASTTLVNGGFEQPDVGATWTYLPQGAVPGWDTSATDGQLELWHTGFNGITAAGGSQFAELNATQASTLSQTIDTSPGQTLEWQLDHRGRGGGNNSSLIPDVMQVIIGAEGGAPVSQGQLSDTVAAWGHHVGTYVVPAGQTRTTLGFQSVSSAGGNPSFGNFLDNVSFGTGPCLITTKSVTNLSGHSTVRPGDSLRYTVSTVNHGGSPAVQATATDTLDPGLHLVPGSMILNNFGVGGSVSAQSGDDAAEYDSGSRTLTARLGTSATAAQAGSVQAQESASLTFTATVDPSAALGTINNDAAVHYLDPLISDPASAGRNSVSNTVSTPIGAAVDLDVASTFVGTSVAGMGSTYTATVTNHGPQAEPNATLTGVIPAALDSAVVTIDGGAPCVVSGGTYSCSLGALAVGASWSVTVAGSLSPSVPAGALLSATSTANSTIYDWVSSNDVAVAKAAVLTSANLSITKQLASTDSPVAGGFVTYTIAIANTGPSDATAVVISDPLGANLSYVSGIVTQGSGSCSSAAGVVSCSFPTIALGATATISLELRLASGAGVTLVTNTATVSASTPDPDLTNNASSVSRMSTVRSDVALDMSADHPTVLAGGIVVYDIAVANSGPSDAETVVVTDVLPAGLGNVSATAPEATCVVSSGVVTCTFASVVAGPSLHHITITATVSPDAPVADMTNAASASTASPDSAPGNNSADATVAVVLKADLAVSMQASAGSAISGTALSYSITITNNGPSRADHVQITDAIPADVLDAVASSPQGVCTIAAGSLTCDLPTLATGATWVIDVSGTLSAQFVAPVLTNSATTTATSPDPVSTNNTATVDLGNDARLVTTKSVVNLSGNSPALPGDVVQYSVSTRNAGGVPADQAVATDVLPVGLSLVAGSITLSNAGVASPRTETVGDDAVDYSAATRTVTARLGASATASLAGSVPAQGISVLSFRATIDVSAAATTVMNQAGVNYTDPIAADPTTTLSSASNATSTAVAPAVDLAVTAEFTSATVAGSTTSIEFTVTNNGPDVEPAASLTGDVPSALDFATVTLEDGTPCSISAGTFTCDLGSLVVGASRMVTIAGVIDSATAAGETIGSQATAGSTLADYATANNSATAEATVETSADLSITKAFVGVTPPVAGGIANYEIVVANDGPSDATSVVVVDSLPGSLVFESAFVASGAGQCDASSGVLTCTFASIAADASVIIELETRVSPSLGGAAVVNAASVTSATPDPQLSNNASAVSRLSDQSADLSIAVTALHTSVHPGDPIAFELTVSNDGPSDASGVVVTVLLPVGIEDAVVSTPDGTCTLASGHVSCTISSIGAGAYPVVITVSGSVPWSAVAQVFVNSASVVSSTPDPVVANNVDSATISVELEADVAVSIESTQASFTAGSAAGYLLVFSNHGPTRADGVHVVDALPAGYIGATVDVPSAAVMLGGATGSCAIVSDTVVCDLDTLAVGQTWTVQISGAVSADFTGTSTVDSATVSTTTPDPALANNQASISTPTVRAIDLATTITSSKSAVKLGGHTTYTITVVNNGPSIDASILTLAVPARRLVVTGGHSSAGSWSEQSYRWVLPALPVGGSATLTLRARLSGAGSSVATVRIAANAVEDSQPLNNVASAAVFVQKLRATRVVLAFTGSNLAPGLLTGGLLFVVGAFALGLDVARRRRARAED
ncbi:MAG: hypothetical protein QOF79_2741 [Actinomycetota bacterium]|nr:hypothetical protein [Actinomycetota bacterium]